VGKGISYCHSCGERLIDAFQYDNRRFCRSCCPSPTVDVVPPAQRRQTSTRLRMPVGPAPKARETTRVRKRNPAGMIVAGAMAAALAVGIAVAAGGSSPPEAETARPLPPPVPAQTEPKPAPAPSLEEALSRIRDLRQSDLMFERREEVLRLLKEAAGRSGPRLEEVDQIAAEYDRKFEQAAARLADFTRSEAMRMAAKQKYADAIERLDGYPAAFRTSKSAEQIRSLRQDFERRRAGSAVPAPAPPQRQVVGRS
jgi:hypothetical protein